MSVTIRVCYSAVKVLSHSLSAHRLYNVIVLIPLLKVSRVQSKITIAIVHAVAATYTCDVLQFYLCVLFGL